MWASGRRGPWLVKAGAILIGIHGCHIIMMTCTAVGCASTSNTTASCYSGEDWARYLSSGIGMGTGDTRRLWCTENGARDGGRRAGKRLMMWFRMKVRPTPMLLCMMPVGLVQILIVVVLRRLKIWWLSLA